MLVPVRRVRRPGGVRGRLDLGQPGRRAVDLDRLPAGVLGDELGRRAGRDRAAVGHDHHRVGQALGLLDVVGRHQDRRALGAQGVDQRPELLAHLRVEADGRLVEQHEARAMHERPRDQQPPAHPAGELVDPRVAAVDEVGHLQRPLDRVAPLGAPDPVEVGEDAQVLLDRQRRVEVVELRDDAALRPGLLRLAGQLEAEHLELALVGDRLRGQQAHRRRLARAVRPEQADARPHGHVEVEPVHRGDRPVPLDDAPQANGEFRTHPVSYANPVSPPAARLDRATRPGATRSRAGSGSGGRAAWRPSRAPWQPRR